MTASTIDLDWAAFDQARGTKPRQAAQPQTAGSNELIPLSPAAQAQVKKIQKLAGLPQTGQLDAGTIAYAKGHYNVNGAGGGKGKGKAKKAGTKKKKKTGSSTKATSAKQRAAAAKAKKLAAAKQKAAMQRAIMLAQQKALEGNRKNSLLQAAAQKKEMMTGKTSTKAVVKAPVAATSTAQLRAQTGQGTGKPITAVVRKKPAKVARVKKGGKRVSLANTRLVDLATGHHVKGTPIRYHHNWVPVTPTEAALYDRMGMGLDPPKIDAPPGASVDELAKLRDRSIAAQRAAQEKAQKWYSHGNPGWENLDDDQDWKDFHLPISAQAKSFWAAYQEPAQYALQNKILRGLDDDAGPRKMLMKAVDYMFKAGGTKAPAKISVYRAVRATDPKAQAFLESLKPGATYKERGMVSTTAMLNDAQGWLKADPDDRYQGDRRINDLDAVLEIQVPKGMQILGGSTQFIETMLHPDTKYKVISVERRHADPTNPIGGDDPEPEFEYDHVTVEAQP
jgi:hypothetical protein